MLNDILQKSHEINKAPILEHTTLPERILDKQNNKKIEITNEILEQYQYKDLYNFSEIIPISALKGDNVEDLIKTIKKSIRYILFFDFYYCVIIVILSISFLLLYQYMN